jgi:hypothetical protein
MIDLQNIEDAQKLAQEPVPLFSENSVLITERLQGHTLVLASGKIVANVLHLPLADDLSRNLK